MSLVGVVEETLVVVVVVVEGGAGVSPPVDGVDSVGAKLSITSSPVSVKTVRLPGSIPSSTIAPHGM